MKDYFSLPSRQSEKKSIIHHANQLIDSLDSAFLSSRYFVISVCSLVLGSSKSWKYIHPFLFPRRPLRRLKRKLLFPFRKPPIEINIPNSVAQPTRFRGRLKRLVSR